MPPLRIYGAGMAGLLTSAMLRRLRPVVMEAQQDLPDNHGALLRFRSLAVQDATHIKFREVNVLKAVKSDGRLRGYSTIRDANLYSEKVTGEYRARSVLDLSPCTRYIAPPTFIADMARDATLKMGRPLTREALEQNHAEGYTTISTIPMPVLMKMVGWEAPKFQWLPIWSTTIEFPVATVDLYQTIYYPEPNVPWYRASITGNKIIVEHTNRADVTGSHQFDLIFADFGLWPDGLTYKVHPPKWQEYGKLLPLPADARQEFILAMTDKYNLYSVGRFATWRQILLDDVVNDVRCIERWVTQRTSYQRRLSSP